VVLVLASLAIAACRGGPEEPADAVPETRRPAGDARVFLLALDGADWEIIDRLESEGRLPNLARLRREGASGVLRSEEPMLSPIVWTTIATGRPPTDHGIVGFLTSRAGKTEPVRSDERRVRAFWNIATDLGVPVGVLGWYASWPAETVNGFLISDRIGTHQVRGTAAPATTGLATPASIVPEIERVRAAVDKEVDDRAAAQFFSAGGKQGGAYVMVDRSSLDTFVGILRTTELYRRLAPMLLDRFDPSLFAVYFEGTDAVGHLFAQFAPPALPGTDPVAARHLAPAFDRYYETIDGVIGEMVNLLDPERATLVIVSDHGFKTGPRRPTTPSVTAYANQAPAWHRSEGVLLLWGRGVRRGASVPDSSLYDVLPTVFRLLDLPLAETLKGKPVEAAFTPELLAGSVPTVPDYEAVGERERAVAGELPAGEALEKLRALGYIGGSSGAGDTDDREPRPGPMDGQSGVPLNRYNEGLILMNAGKSREALEVFTALQRDEPSFALGYLGNGLVLLRERRAAEAVTVLETAVRIDPRLAAAQAALGEAYLMADRREPARRALARSIEIDPSNGRTAFLLAQLHFERREFRRAGQLYESARSLAEKPRDRAGACVGLAVIAEEDRRLDDAEGLYEQALGIIPDFPPALERYANLQLYRQRPERAVELLGRLVAARPDSPQAFALYGRALSFAGKDRRAREALEKSLALNPQQPDVRAMLDKLVRATS
jgi:predicted AlkP superfamily phosphohydrolase/phosphomutase/tetratricopeptide (TPR) repeat protein